MTFLASLSVVLATTKWVLLVMKLHVSSRVRCKLLFKIPSSKNSLAAVTSGPASSASLVPPKSSYVHLLPIIGRPYASRERMRYFSRRDVKKGKTEADLY